MQGSHSVFCGQMQRLQSLNLTQLVALRVVQAMVDQLPPRAAASSHDRYWPGLAELEGLGQLDAAVL